MAFEAMVLEGTWEEIRAHDSELKGRTVRLVVIPEEVVARPTDQPAFRPAQGPSTARSLLEHTGTWEGDDLEERLAEVYAARSKAKF